MKRSLAIIVLSESALPLAQRLVAVLPGARIHGLAARVPDAEEPFTDTAAHLRELFRGDVAIIGLCAAGILIRILGPLLQDKREEPPVLAVTEDGGAVVPLLGGHHGANELAREIGRLLGVTPAITTAGDARFGVAFDDPPPGYRLANPEHGKEFMAALLAGANVRLEGEAAWLARSALPFDRAGSHAIEITERAATGASNRLVYHPAVLAIGVGCERGAGAEEILALVCQCLAERGLAEGAVAGVFSLNLKMDEPAIHELAAKLRVPARFFSAATLEAEAPRLANPSDVVFREVGCHGVAEGAALAAVSAQGHLIVAKHISARATCAVAQSPMPFDGAKVGRARGKLFIVGIGPGSSGWLTPEASELLSETSDLVGYRLYLDLLGPLAWGKVRHDFALGEEEARVRKALALAAEGRAVALVSSGDPGIYAMASLAFELVERGLPEWRRIAIRVAPGITAMQAAAARVGAPLGHDFCAISLSDLMTPWSIIERRLRAAAEGDFVIALYNPASQRRTRQLAVAQEVLLAHRAPETPVVLARNLGRDGERVEVMTLAELAAAAIDMSTLVLIGSSATRRVARGDGGVWVYTPRGYEAAQTAKEAG